MALDRGARIIPPVRVSARPIVLASASPRRKRLLEQLGLDYRAVPVDVDESAQPTERPEAVARRLALAKAQAVEDSMRATSVILAADTIVTLGGRLLGKPKGADEAREMLRALRGRAHRVITGLAVLIPGLAPVSEAVDTTVWMRNYTDGEIEGFIASGEPLDKAGAYAIQSEKFHPAERVDGCYLNVVGLPMCHVRRALAGAGIPIDARPADF